MNSPILNKKILSELREKLEEEKGNLEKELARFAEKNPKSEGDWKAKYVDIGDDRDQNSQEVSNFDARLGLEKTLEGRLQKVTGALDRLKEEEYGYCEVDGEPIPIDRLRANPATTVCLEHAK